MTITTDRKETEIGMIPQEWEILKLWEISKFRQWLQVPLEDQSLEKQEWMVRFIRIVDYTKNWEEPPRFVKDTNWNFHVSRNDLIMIRYGSQTAWKVMIWWEWIIANNMFKIEIDESIVNTKYLYRYLSDDLIYQKLNNSQWSSTMPALTFWIVGNLLIPIPPIEVQNQIAETLTLIDDRKELLNQEFETLNMLWKTIFKWFLKTWNINLI